MYLNDNNREIINQFISRSFLQKLLYMGRGLDIAEAFNEYINADYKNQNEKRNKLRNVLWKDGTKHISEVFQGKDYGALKLLLGDYLAGVFKKVWDNATSYIYTGGYLRRSYRTDKASVLYLNGNIEKLKECVYLAASGFTLDKYFSDNKTGYQDISIISDIIALELDNGNGAVLDKLREIAYSDNNTAIITREIIKGLLKSRNKEAHKIIGELLLAAKLQEGLRQAIVESLDECSEEGFIYILKIIIDNNLTRFSSVARAFCVWTGLNLDIERPKVVNKCFEAAYRCLSDEAYKVECIASNENLLIYIGIWSIAFREIEDIDQPLRKLLSSSEKYKKLVALQFLYDTQFSIYAHERACSVLEESDLEVLALAVKNLFGGLNVYSIRHSRDELNRYFKLKNNCHGTELFMALKNIADKMPSKEIEFKGSVFPWIDFKFTAQEILEKMILAVAVDYDNETVDTLIAYKDKMSVDSRQMLVENFLKEPKSVQQKVALLEACGDRGTIVRDSAFKIVNSLELTAEDYNLVENLLQYKSGDLRKSAIKLLLKQSDKELVSCVQRLTVSSNENKRMAAIDIASALEGSKKRGKAHEECLNAVAAMKEVSQKEMLLADNVSGSTKNNRTLENGLGLYKKSYNYNVPPVEKPKGFNMKAMFSMTAAEYLEILSDFSSLIHENRDFEYETTGWDDTKTTVTLGGSPYLQSFARNNYTLDNYPLAEKIRALVKQKNLSPEKLLQLDFYRKSNTRRYNKYLPWYESILEDNLNYGILRNSSKTTDKLPYIQIISTYINLLAKEIPGKLCFETGKNVSEYLFATVPSDKHQTEYVQKDSSYYYHTNRKDYIASSPEIDYWLLLMRNNVCDDESYKIYFNISYNYYLASNYNVHSTLTLDNFGRALELGLIEDSEIFKELIERPLSTDNIASITMLHKHDRNNLRKYARLVEIGEEVANNLAAIEIRRGELNTEVTHLAAKVGKCYGAAIFTEIVLRSEKDTYVRGYNFIGGDCTRKQMLSHLLKCCYPKKGEDAKTLGEYLKGKKVTARQLIEAAMYSPQWLDIVSEYLNYDGLKSACWYFHAHVNDFFSDEKSAIITRYSPIAVQDLKDGAFDQQWFMEAYSTIGEKNFKLVYDSAKYIAGGGLHKRSQLFADATLGKLDVKEVKKRVMDKRNKDYLLTYGLIPVKDRKDLLERYEYIHQYIKESKQFGSQRQASEGRSAAIALLNLARNAGYSDVNRLSWNMETARLDSVRSYLEPHKLEDIELQLVVDELGQAEILCSKEGKLLKDIPAKLKKHEYVTELKALRKALREQYVRARHSFEVSMENEEEFTAEELINLCNNPVLAPIIKNLVFKSGCNLGYINEGNLVDFKNDAYTLKPEDKVIIAHPVSLYEAGCWPDYQRDIYAKKLVQPFRQVFRELYLPNSDELKEQTLSRRYAGHQVQPKKTAALLKTRGWTASHEEGLQKVYYKENIVATIYALADWFSPADIEAPTIEFVRFEDRVTFKPVAIDKVPKLIFSEVMRDVDLVVSVAHVGGVDPEASLSTVEIRTVIVDELLKLLKLQNVVLKGSHAHITGVHGEYTVHLGSGVVHKMGKGSINILPVHSGQRGRIFLPFIDSDPKSAEILSKIILLAEDTKIKDPSILEQICG